MKKKVAFLLIAVLLLTNCQSDYTKVNYIKFTPSILLADGGKAFYDIVQVGEMSSPEQDAIADLTKYLHRMSGAEFEVKQNKEEKPAIFIGTKQQEFFDGKFSHLQVRDSFSIRAGFSRCGSALSCGLRFYCNCFCNLYLSGRPGLPLVYARRDW